MMDDVLCEPNASNAAGDHSVLEFQAFTEVNVGCVDRQPCGQDSQRNDRSRIYESETPQWRGLEERPIERFAFDGGLARRRRSMKRDAGDRNESDDCGHDLRRLPPTR